MGRSIPIVIAALSAAWLAWQWLVDIPPLPDPMVSRFGFDGQPHGRMGKTAYSLTMGLIAAWTLLVFCALGLLRHLPDRLINVPSRHHWLAPERREATLARIVNDVRWLLALTLAFLAAVGKLVIMANLANPPHMSTAILWLLAAYTAASIAVVVMLLVHFGRPRS